MVIVKVVPVDERVSDQCQDVTRVGKHTWTVQFGVGG